MELSDPLCLQSYKVNTDMKVLNIFNISVADTKAVALQGRDVDGTRILWDEQAFKL